MSGGREKGWEDREGGHGKKESGKRRKKQGEERKSWRIAFWNVTGVTNKE